MKKFGEKFKEYEPFGIKHVAIPDTGDEYEAKFERYGLYTRRIPEKTPKKMLKKEPHALRVLKGSEIPAESKKELNKVVVEAAPTANVYQIPADQKDLAEFIKKTLSEFNYYIVELGLNVLAGRKFKIPELLFEVDLKCDGERTDVTAYDIAPDDTIKHVKIISGKISLGVTNLLKFIPGPIGQVLPNLINIEINPWEFEWGFDKYMIDAAGKKNYRVYWKVYETNVVQGFNPAMVLRARKGVNVISAGARVVYKLKAGRWDITPEIQSNEIDIKIWPM